MENSTLIQAIILAFYFIGAVIHTVVFRTLIRRAAWGKRELSLNAVIGSLAIYFGGLFTGQLLSLTLGEIAAPVTRSLFLLAFCSVSLTPPLLLITSLIYEQSISMGILRRIPSKIFHSLIFLPTLVLWVYGIPRVKISATLGTNPFSALGIGFLIQPFAIWFVVCLLSAAVLSWRIQMREEDLSTKKFMGVNAATLIGVALIILLVVTVEEIADSSMINSWLWFFAAVSGIAPVVILGYFIYRYQFLNFVIKPSLLYTLFTGLILALYLLGIRKLGNYLADSRGVNSTMIEGILLVLLILLTQPIKNKLHRITTNLFFKERLRYQRMLQQVSSRLAGIFDLTELLGVVRNKLSEILGIERLFLILWDRSGMYTIFPKNEINPDDLQLTIARLDMEKKSIGIGIESPGLLQKELRATGINLVVPLLKGEEILGAIFAGPKRTGERLSGEERAMIETISAQAATAIDNVRLFQQQLSLERKILEAEKLSTLGMFTASIAHEIKNPLSSISVLVQTLMEEQNELFSKSEELELIDGEIHRLRNVLTQLLRYAKPESDDGGLEGVDEIIQEVFLLLRGESENANVNLTIHSPENDIVIKSNRDTIKEILFNLVLNAIQSVEDGGNVSISVAERGRRDNVTISVTDTGSGIPPDQIARICEPFYTTRSSGTGLGLTIVKKKIERAGGTLDFQSKVGMGTTVTFTLPILSDTRR